MRVSALVLAAGASRRAGAVNKLLARDRTGCCMIARTVMSVLQSRVAAVIVVLGHDATAVATALDGAGLHPDGERLHRVRADDHDEGLSASLRCGIAVAAGQGADAALVCLADMPLVRAATLDRLLAELDRDTQAVAAVPTAGGRRGNPVLWRSSLFGALLGLSGDRGGRLLLERRASSVREVPVDDAGVLEDFDTPDRLAEYALHS